MRPYARRARCCIDSSHLPDERRETLPSFAHQYAPNGEMSDQLDGPDEIQADDAANGQTTQIERDRAFCARMRVAIAAGLENAPIGVVTAPGTKNPKYVATEPRRPLFSSRDMEIA